MKYVLALIAISLLVLSACAQFQVPVENSTTPESIITNPESNITIPEINITPEVKSCDTMQCSADQQCKFGEVFKNGECGCGNKFKRCGEQLQCIPYDACCGIAVCNPDDNFNRVCINTKYGAQLCYKTATGEHCRYAYQNERTSFSVGKEGADVIITQVFADESLDINVTQKGEKTGISKLKINNKTSILNGATIEYKRMAETGGNCRSDTLILDDESEE